ILWCYVTMCFVFFFFQAEDGIRDDLVTGVQTCALPIYTARSSSASDAFRTATAFSGAPARRPRRRGSPRARASPRQVRARIEIRSEERRVGKEGRTWWGEHSESKKRVEE